MRLSMAAGYVRSLAVRGLAVRGLGGAEGSGPAPAWEPASAGAPGLELLLTEPARPGPLGRHRVDRVGHRVGGPLVVDPPAREVGPGVGWGGPERGGAPLY